MAYLSDSEVFGGDATYLSDEDVFGPPSKELPAGVKPSEAGAGRGAANDPRRLDAAISAQSTSPVAEPDASEPRRTRREQRMAESNALLDGLTPTSSADPNASGITPATFDRPGFAAGFSKGYNEAKAPEGLIGAAADVPVVAGIRGRDVLRLVEGVRGGFNQDKFKNNAKSVLDDTSSMDLGEEFAPPVGAKLPIGERRRIEPRTPSIYPTGGASEAVRAMPGNFARSAGSMFLNFGALASEFGIGAYSPEQFRAAAQSLDRAKTKAGLAISDDPLFSTGTALDEIVPSARTLADYAPEGIKQLGMAAAMGPFGIIAESNARGFNKARSDGASLLPALGYGAATALSEGVPEAFSAKFAIDAAKRIPIMKALRGDAKALTTAMQQTSAAMGVELGSEQLSALGNYVADYISADPTATPDRLVNDLKEAVKATLVQGPTMLGGAKAAQAAAGALRRPLTPEEEIARQINATNILGGGIEDVNPNLTRGDAQSASAQGPSAEALARAKGFLLQTATQPDPGIQSAQTVDQAIAAATASVADTTAAASTVVENISNILNRGADASPAAAVPPVDPATAGGGLIDAPASVGLGNRDDGTAIPAVVQPADARLGETGDDVSRPAGGNGDAAVAPEVAAVTSKIRDLEGRQESPTTEPVKTWFGRRGDGYLTAGDASMALPTRQRIAPDLNWTVEQMPDGKFRLAGYARQSQPTSLSVQPAVTSAAPNVSTIPQNLNTSAQPVENSPETAQVGPFGVDMTPIAQGGKPFKTKAQADAFRKANTNGMKVIKSGKGFALRELTPAEAAARERAAKRMGRPNVGPAGMPISAHGFIAADGGLAQSVMADAGFDRNTKVGNRWLFAGKDKPGMTLEQATQKLIEAGYLPEGASQNDALALIKKSVTTPQYTPEGWEQIAQAEQDTRFEDHLAAQQDAATDEDPFGDAPAFTPAEIATVPKSIREEYAALMQAAEDAGIDTEAIIEEAARIGENWTQEQFNEHVRQALEAAIAGSRRQPDRGAGIGQGREDAQRGGTESGGQDAGRPSGEEDGQPAEGLTSPTRADILAQQDRAERADELDQRERIRQESEQGDSTFMTGFTGDARQDTTGDIFGASEQETQQAQPAAPTVQSGAQTRPAPTRARVTPQVASAAQLRSFIGIAADSVEKLRASDVDRVISETPAQFRLAVAEHIRGKRPDLAAEVDDVMAELQPSNAPAPQAQPATEAEIKAKADAPATQSGPIADLGEKIGGARKPVEQQDDDGTATLFSRGRVDDTTRAENLKRWSNNAPYVSSAEADTYDFKSGQKVMVEAYHGTARPDRVGTVFQRKRATSGPMAFFTSSPELASSYAQGKSDTSITDEERVYPQWFKYKPAGQRSAVDIVRAWNFLDNETKDRIAALAPRIKTDDATGEQIELGPEGTTNGVGNYEWELQQTQRPYDRRGNPLRALVEGWLNGGILFNDEERFLRVLELAGFPVKDVNYDAPNASYPFVYKAYIAMQKPLVTGDVPQPVIDALKDAAKRDRSRAQVVGADMWDKNTRTLREWVATYTDPSNTSASYVWTSIPDKVTEVLKSLGYDGIIDWSGKGGGDRHPVYIPFEETQVKSATGNKGTFDPMKKDIRFSRANDEDPGVAGVLLEMGRDPALFQYPRSDAPDVETIARAKGLKAGPVDRNDDSNNAKWLIANTTPADGPGVKSWMIELPGGRFATLTDRRGEVYINVSSVGEGMGGSAVYDLAANYAFNNGKVFIGDPNGVSEAAMRRRLENMLSSAVKYQTTDHLKPHPDQLAGRPEIGVPALEWTDGDTEANIESMVAASVAAGDYAKPLASANVNFSTDSQSFSVGGNNVLDAEELARDLSGLLGFPQGENVLGAGGNRTLQRAAVFRALLSSPDARRQLLDRIRGQQGDAGPRVGPGLKGIFYSRGQQRPGGLTRQQFTDQLARAFGARVADRLIAADVVVPLDSQQNLPAHVVPFLRDGDIVYGFYDPRTNRTYAVLENLTPEMVKGLALHEVGVHYGFKAMLGDAKYDNVMKRLDVMERGGSKAVRQARKDAKANAARPSQVPEETLAYLVQNNPEMGLVQEVIAKIKAFLFREFGIGGKYLTESDITMLARAAVQHAARTEDGGVTLPEALRDIISAAKQSFSRGAEFAQPFYSALSRALEDVNASAMPAAMWKDRIKGMVNKGQAKADEVEWTGINEWLDTQQGKVTKGDVLAYLDANGVQVQEVTLGSASPNKEALLTADDIRVEPEGDLGRWFIESPTGSVTARAESEAEAVAFGVRYFNSQITERNRIAARDADNTKYGSYTLPGGPLSRDTEILSRDGWLRMDEVQVGDVVMTRRDEDGRLEWQEVEAVPTVYADKLYHFKNQSIDMRVTACHNMLVKRRRRSSAGLFRAKAADLWGMSECVAPLVGEWRGEATADLYGYRPEDAAELIGWYIAEGSAVTGGGKKSTLAIAQSREANPGKCARIEALLSRMGIAWNYVASGPSYYLSIKTMDRGLVDVLHAQGDSRDKFVPGFIFDQPPAVLRSLMDGMLLGDGHLACANDPKREPRWIYFTNCKRLADDMQLLALLCGLRATIGQRPTGLYEVRINSKQWASIDDAKHAIVDYNDTAFCVTVKNHAIYVRTGGVAAFTGNSNYREVLLTLPDKTGLAQQKRNSDFLDLREDVSTRLKQDIRNLYDARNQGLLTADEKQRLDAIDADAAKPREQAYKSSHWDQPNVLAHIRVNDRESVEPLTEQQQADNRKRAEMLARADAISQKMSRAARDARIAGDIRREELLTELRPLVRAGKMTPLELTRRLDDAAFAEPSPEMAAMIREREQIMAALPPEHKPRKTRVLFVEELQSDWGQEGKKRGFNNPNTRELQMQHNAGVQNLGDAILDLAPPSGIPAAPFVTSTDKWLNLALKRIMVMAAQEGYDKVAFVNGEQSAERYDLSKQVGSVRWASKTGSDVGKLTVKDLGGNVVLRERTAAPIKAADLEGFIGKELARKLIESQPSSTTPYGDEIRELKGLDLKVGGEGMIAFYDKIVPAAVSKMLAKVGGGKLETVEIAQTGDAADNWRRTWPDSPLKTLLQPGFTITPEMREAVAGGMPLFQRAYHGTPHTVDKFSTDKIGTGEGAQAFGWGLYFASRREVANYYRQTLSRDQLVYTIGGKQFSELSWLRNSGVEEGWFRNWVAEPIADGRATAGDAINESASDTIYRLMNNMRRAGNVKKADALQRLLKMVEAGEISAERKRGQLYEVEIPEDSDMLLWDKPLSEQPEKVREALNRWIADREGISLGTLDAIRKADPDKASGTATGKEIYERLARRLANPEGRPSWTSISNDSDDRAWSGQRAASETLASLGIKGIKYLDGGSRADGDGSYNYVIFSGDDVEIQNQPAFSRATNQTETPEFRAWFKDSKVVDAQGRPLVVYHGTTADLSAFDLAFSGSDGVAYDRPAIFATDDAGVASDYARNKRNRNIADAGRAFQRYKNENPGEYGEEYERLFNAYKAAGRKEGWDTGVGANVLPLYLSIQNPLEVEGGGARFMQVMPDAVKRAAEQGHDGVIARNVIDHASPASEYPVTVYVAFRPEQIKSAIGNNGQFDPENPDIRFSRAAAGEDTDTDPAPRRPSRWFDAAGRFRFYPGTVLYELIGKLASPLLARAYMKSQSKPLRRAIHEMKLTVQKAQDTATDVAREVVKLTEDERQMVSDIIEQELAAGVNPPEHAIRLAAMMTENINTQTDELVKLGMLTPETAEKWRGRYLARYYKDKLGARVQSAWERAISPLGKKPMRGIRGNHFKGRGMTQVVPEENLQAWLDNGWQIDDPDYQKGVADDQRVRLWRDFTRAEREKMGEIRDAGFRFVMGYMETQKDLALGRMFQSIAANPELSSRNATEEMTEQVPDGTIPGTGVKRYGKLAGRYVSKETISHLSAIEESQSEAFKMYRKAMGIWKETKTALNPVAHANNIISNLSMAHFAGVSYWDAHKYLAAMRDFAGDGKAVREAKDAGLFLGTISDAELMNTLPDDLKAIVRQQDSALSKLGGNAFNAMTWFLRKPMGKAYQAEDTFFRYLIWKDARDRGMSAEDAVEHSLRYIFAYDDLPRTARYIRDFGIPFFAYTYKVAPALLHTALNYPWRFAAPAAVLWAANAAAYAIAAGDDEDDWLERLQKYINDPAYREKAREKEKLERENLPEWMKGNTSLMTPKAIRLGMDEVTKLPLFFDVSRIVPGGDIFDATNNAGGVPMLQPLMPNHPLIGVLSAIYFDKDPFFGKEIVSSTDTSEEAAQKRLAWMWRQVSPALAYGNYHFERTMQALASATGQPIQWAPEFMGGAEATGVGRDGLPVQPKYAAMQTFGIKVRPIDTGMGEIFSTADKNRMLRELDAQVRRLGRLNSTGAVSDKTFDKEVEKIDVKRDRLNDGLTIDGEPR